MSTQITHRGARSGADLSSAAGNGAWRFGNASQGGREGCAALLPIVTPGNAVWTSYLFDTLAARFKVLHRVDDLRRMCAEEAGSS